MPDCKRSAPSLFTIVSGTSRSVRQQEARPCKALKVNSKIFKSDLKQTGSQCNEAKAGVMRSRFLVLVLQPGSKNDVTVVLG